MIIFTETNTVFTDDLGNIITVPNSHTHYEKINRALRENDLDEALRLSDVESTIKKSISTSNWVGIEIIDGEVYYGDQILGGYVVDKILDLHANDIDYTPLKLFVEKLMQNPNKSSIEELFEFLEFSSLPITSDGDFVAYKKVRSDFTDIHSGKFDNSVGAICEMERQDVNPDRNQTCSTGLHFCSKDYLKHFGAHDAERSRIILIKINPADVVSIPSDYNNTKGRACRYEVIEDITDQFFEDGDEKHSISDSPVYDDWDEPEYDDDDYDDLTDSGYYDEVDDDDFEDAEFDNDLDDYEISMIQPNVTFTVTYVDRDEFDKAFSQPNSIDDWRTVLGQAAQSKTKTELADILNTSRRTLGRWLDGERDPDEMTQQEIVNAFRVNINFHDAVDAVIEKDWIDDEYEEIFRRDIQNEFDHTPEEFLHSDIEDRIMKFAVEYGFESDEYYED